jgi:hypothetical protein
MKTANEIGSAYTLVSELQKGDTVINLGIIKNIFPNQPDGTIKIQFEPKRSRSTGMMIYLPTDKLKTA